MLSDKPQEECGIVGIWDTDGQDVAELLHLGLYGIQHRGQQSAGIAVIKDSKMISHKALGLVSEVFDLEKVQKLGSGKAGVGHVGYNTLGGNMIENAQPLVLRYTKGHMAISYNGCLLNGAELRNKLEDEGHVFQSSSDAEVIACLLSMERIKCHSIEDALVKVMKIIKGAYSILVLTPNKLVAARDSMGMKPLSVGIIGNSYIFSSETSGIITLGGKIIRDVLPGEVLVANNNGVRSIYTKTSEKTAMCIFEFVYLARTDSYIDGVSVYGARFEAGRILAQESPVDADIVISMPESATPAALGFAEQSKIPYVEGLNKNRYIGRTFIQPTQAAREIAVGLKLTPIKNRIEGKRVVIIDDSIVRGTTTKRIVQMLKSIGGATEVHVRVCSPPVKFSCHYGIDTQDESSLIANQMEMEKIKEFIGADSLAFISNEGLAKSPVGAKCSFCYACFDGNYPL